MVLPPSAASNEKYLGDGNSKRVLLLIVYKLVKEVPLDKAFATDVLKDIVEPV